MDILQHEELRMGVVVCGGTRAKNWWSLDTAVTPTFSIARPCPIAILSYERKEPCTSSSSISSANCPVSSTLWLECILPELGAREDFGQRPPSDISLYICREDIAADLPSVDDEGPLWKKPEYYALLFYSSVAIRRGNLEAIPGPHVKIRAHLQAIASSTSPQRSLSLLSHNPLRYLGGGAGLRWAV